MTEREPKRKIDGIYPQDEFAFTDELGVSRTARLLGYEKVVEEGESHLGVRLAIGEAESVMRATSFLVNTKGSGQSHPPFVIRIGLGEGAVDAVFTGEVRSTKDKKTYRVVVGETSKGDATGLSVNRLKIEDVLRFNPSE